LSINNYITTLAHNQTEWIVERLPAIIHRERSGVINYVVAIVLLGVALLVRLQLAPVEAGLQYVAFFPAVTITAVVGGIWPGIFATIIGLSIATFIFTFPYYSISIEAIKAATGGNLVFLMDGVIVSSSIEAMHRYRARYAAELEEINHNQQAMLAQQERINGLVDAAMDAIISIDENQNIILFNAGAEQVFGYRSAEIIGKPLELLIPIRFRGIHVKHMHEFGKTGLTARTMNYLGQTYGLRSNGEEFPFEATISRIETEGMIIYTAILRDITERNHAEELLRKSEERYRALFDNSIDGYAHCKMIYEGDKAIDFEYIDVNPAFETLTGLKKVVGQKVSEIIPGIRESNPELIETYGRVALTGKPERFESFVAPIGIWFFVTVYSYEREYFVAIFENITERKTNEELVNKLAFYDSLTQLPNRRLLEDRMDQAFAACKRSGRYGAVMFLDLDNFKPLNDTHGHKSGDMLLVEVAHRLASCVREVDTVARFGGDEFVVVLSELEGTESECAEQAKIIAEKISAAIGQPFWLATNTHGSTKMIIHQNVGASIGVALFNSDSETEKILKYADHAMYKAKEAGRNSIKFYIASENGR
jgi:diguanylate cyclase (GGDEF)-like protein/PAS domain S-box-containing protein